MEKQFYRHKESGTLYVILSKNSKHKSERGWVDTITYTPARTKQGIVPNVYSREVAEFKEKFEPCYNNISTGDIVVLTPQFLKGIKQATSGDDIPDKNDLACLNMEIFGLYVVEIYKDKDMVPYFVKMSNIRTNEAFHTIQIYLFFNSVERLSMPYWLLDEE
jgi:hypothetical protein